MYRRILAALDGSQPSLHGGDMAIRLAAALEADLYACHVYSAGLHAQRFRDMEPGLPAEYQRADSLAELRGFHDALIDEGFQSLSDGYIDPVTEKARLAGVAVRAVTPSGRNYVRILEQLRALEIDLLILGAEGLGAIGDGLLGSTAARVLQGASCDVLIVHEPMDARCVLAGIDGSEHAARACRIAQAWARALGCPLRLAAAYDPAFHNEVFRMMARALPASRQEQVGLAEQEDLHETLINEGLAKLYRDFLDEARREAETEVPAAHAALLEGKGYRALADHAERIEAGLLVVGRFGHHAEPISRIGSNAEALCRVAGCNVLVVGGAAASAGVDGWAERSTAPQADVREATGPEAVGELAWDEAALRRLERVPSFAREMARRAVESAARRQGAERVTEAIFNEVARQFGMG